MENKKIGKKNITIELAESERDLLLKTDYVLYNEFIKKLSNAKFRNGYCQIILNYSLLEEIVGHVCFLANHEEDSDIWEELNDLADHLEVYL